MADHFMEAVNLRFTAVDERIDTEIASMQQHFAEQRLFLASELAQVERRLHETMQQGFTATFFKLGRLEERMDGLEVRMDGLEARMDRLEGRMDGLEARMDRLEGRMDGLESKLDTHLAMALEILRDVQRRLPPRV